MSGATDTAEDLVLAERHGDHVLVLTVNRPERRNAFDVATACAFEAQIDAYEGDDALRAAVVTGAGGVFSAGQDLRAAATGELAVTPRRGAFGVIGDPPRKPLIAAIEGHALAGGLELALGCDVIVASRTAQMGLPEASRSLLAIGGGLFRLPRRVPHHIALELAMTGRPTSAVEMHRHGLVNRLAEPGEALEVALGLAEEIAMAGPLAVIASKEIIRRSQEWTDEEAWTAQMPIAEPVMRSEDWQEGLRAFAEKRDPIWRGR